ncbi:TcaA NTF2-like domain-containing protein [Macrococcus bovicus]|uniref:TcaA protein NTF2-like domain-containing protein n=1 Tax=Macrococcus bovicus TaxID=69968 RepID=A0A4R6BZQ7_9STAP|nr:hypothetical protein [Macrococcus bovicus]TDM13669.1 hypothetical protein ERX55_07695 [Macrococcus bovicus]
MKKLLSASLMALLLAGCAANDDTKQATEKTTDHVTTEQAGTEKESTDQMTTEQPATEQPETDQPKTDAPQTESPATEKAKAETEDPQTDTPSTENAEKHNDSSGENVPVTQELARTVNYSALAKRQVTNYMNQMPSAFNSRDLSALNTYIKQDSEAARYLRNKLPAGYFDNYQIARFTIDQVKNEGLKQHVVTTRVMTSNATGGQWKKVVTVYDLVYNPATKSMQIYDFNDQVIYSVDNAQDKALKAISDKYRIAAEQEAGSAVRFEKADPAVEQDVSGTYYRFKAVDAQNRLVHSYKYYQKSGQMVVE